METLTLTRPDDWHLHCRDGDEMLALTIPASAQVFSRAIIMPNLSPAVETVEQALSYRKRILQHSANYPHFTPLMTLYLRENTTLDTLKYLSETPEIIGCKLYPAGATTHSAQGVKDLKKIYPLLEAMEKWAIPLLIHGEVTDPNIDIFEREKVFINETLREIVLLFPALRIVLEHISSQEAVDFILSTPANLGASITAHHLLLNRNALFINGLRPNNYCLPILKTEKDRLALIRAATSGNPKFFLGTDSAPHLKTEKESSCCPAGIFTAPIALPLYATIFEQANALDKLEGFASFAGADFYQLPRNTETITIEKKKWTIPSTFALKNDKIIPFKANETLDWKIKGLDL